MKTVSRLDQSLKRSTPDLRRTRPQVIRDMTQRCFDETGMRPTEFTAVLISNYMAMTPEHCRSLPMQDIPQGLSLDDAEKLLEARRGRVRAYMDPNSSSHFPAEIEEAWVQSLPEPYRSDLRHALVRRHGCLGVDPVEGETPEDDLRGISDVLARVSKVAEKYAPMIADGVLDEKDAGSASAAIDACDEAAAALIGLRKRIADRTKGKAAA